VHFNILATSDWRATSNHPIKLVGERPCALPIASKRFEPQRHKGHKEIRIALFFVPLAAEASQLETDKSTRGDCVRQVRARSL